MIDKENFSDGHNDFGIFGSELNRAYVVEESENPSSDFFVVPALKKNGLEVIKCRFGDLPLQQDLVGAVVVFVRYVPSSWLKLIELVSPQLCHLIFFMDDDVLDFNASIDMPLRYRYKLARLSARHKKWLQKKNAKLWVSTPYLQQKYNQWQPRLVLPSPIAETKEICRIFYHGSASHTAEIIWLKPIIEQVLQCDDNVTFEIIGGRDVYQKYRSLERVTVVNPMKWPAYQSFLLMSGRHIGLAPLLDSVFNRARSYTKFFDITHAGAVGVYSADSACAEVVNDGIDGIVVMQEQSAWVEAILNLADDEPLRRKILKNAEDKLVELSHIASRNVDNVVLHENVDKDL